MSMSVSSRRSARAPLAFSRKMRSQPAEGKELHEPHLIGASLLLQCGPQRVRPTPSIIWQARRSLGFPSTSIPSPTGTVSSLGG
jgi:hypothetical protein